MREMKDSGARWIGLVPTHWKVDKLKYHLKRNEPRNPGNCIVLSLYRELGVVPKDSRDDNHNVTSEDTSKYKYVKPGDFVINKMKAWQGSVAVSDYEGIVSPAYFVYNFTDEAFFKRYFHYLLRSCYKDEFMRLSGGIRVGQWDLPSEALDNVIVLIPSTEEQRCIAAYLDAKCAEIDALTADIQTQIDTLEQYKRSVITEVVTKGLEPDVEMKDSGIQWIGSMPAHWNCIRGKYVLKYIQKPVREDDGVITCFRDGEVTLRSNRREDGFTMADKEIGYQGIDVGDLVVHGMDGFAGAIGISDSRGKASPVLNVLDTEQNKRYIMYFLRSMAYSDVFLALATGIRVRSCDLRWNKLSELFYPVPPLEEQEAIVDYIDSVLRRTDEVIAAKREQLSTLEAYKKSLIYEYVTGKKEVPAQ
ncbi:restriction endonuclease subunit S [Clostridium phoceensis]|jgi:type I restriction enzyme S subunit|uniref:restriction endonuclease subunit S n=1 Tax=Clostridium phoceensis TaxID=1650661 RepID=UPI00067E8E74|nr:restriction endonuclease subunit S [Clostridium phoceensis]